MTAQQIGRAVTVRFAAEGAHVVVSGRDERRGAEVVATIRGAGGRADFVSADLGGDPAESRTLAERTPTLLDGRLDVLVNNAGIYPAGHSTATADADLFDALFGVNVKAPFLLTQALVPRWLERGDGVIINLGSWITGRAVPWSPL